MKHFYDIVLTALLITTMSCQKTAAPYISVGQDTYEVQSESVELNIPVKCNVSSSASIEYEGEESGWIFLLPSVLYGDGVYSLWIDEYNDVLEDRSAILKITAGSESKEVRVVQFSRNSIGISPMNLATKTASGTFPVEVACSKSWTVSLDKDCSGWLAVDKTQGEGVGTVNVSVEALQNDSETKTGHITFTSGDLSVQMVVQHGYAQQIGNLVWAKANVGEPGMFASSPDDVGMLYQYNSRVAWPNSYPETSPCPEGMVVGQTDNGYTDWSRENDPCPEGWRIPSIEEIRTLVGLQDDKKFYWLASETSGFKIPGVVAGIDDVDAATATSVDMKGGIFIPQSGNRDRDTGEQLNTWSATMTSRTRPGQNWDMYILWIDSSDSFSADAINGNLSAYPVRCVAE